MVYAGQTRLTILNARSSPAADPQALALSALGWVLGVEARAQRLLALTGLTPDALRAGLSDPAVLGAVLEFLAAHEPDLVACAAALDIEPVMLVRTAESFAR